MPRRTPRGLGDGVGHRIEATAQEDSQLRVNVVPDETEAKRHVLFAEDVFVVFRKDEIVVRVTSAAHSGRILDRHLEPSQFRRNREKLAARSVGVKAGGVGTHSMVEIEVICLPGNLPEYIEVDLESIDIGGSVHLADIVVSDDIEILALTHGDDHNLPVAQIVQTRSAASDDDDVAADDAEGSVESEE